MNIKFLGTCENVNPKYRSIFEAVWENAGKEITCKTFFKAIPINVFKKDFQYSNSYSYDKKDKSKMFIGDDYAIEFRKKVYKNRIFYIFSHSCIEYIWEVLF